MIGCISGVSHGWALAGRRLVFGEKARPHLGCRARVRRTGPVLEGIVIAQNEHVSEMFTELTNSTKLFYLVTRTLRHVPHGSNLAEI